MSELEQRMHRAILELAVISTAPVANREGYTTHGKAETKPPPASEAPHIEFAARWRDARTDTEREHVVDDAEAEVRSWRYSRRNPADTGTHDGRLMVGFDPRHVQDVAHIYRCSVRHVYRMRAYAKDWARSNPDLAPDHEVLQVFYSSDVSVRLP